MNRYGKGRTCAHAFEDGGYLPAEILFRREKAAFSDAVGHSMVDYLRAYAETQYTDGPLNGGRNPTPTPSPFTKSLCSTGTSSRNTTPAKARWW